MCLEVDMIVNLTNGTKVVELKVSPVVRTIVDLLHPKTVKTTAIRLLISAPGLGLAIVPLGCGAWGIGSTSSAQAATCAWNPLP